MPEARVAGSEWGELQTAGSPEPSPLSMRPSQVPGSPRKRGHGETTQAKTQTRAAQSSAGLVGFCPEASWPRQGGESVSVQPEHCPRQRWSVLSADQPTPRAMAPKPCPWPARKMGDSLHSEGPGLSSSPGETLPEQQRAQLRTSSPRRVDPRQG